MIPKVIHYCWFGKNPLPKMAQKCIKSWKKYCPDYEIVEWNEDNFDINCCAYVKEAYEAKKWAFVSDVARLYVLVKHGGVYMDTDVELLKSIDPFLSYEAFSGFESSGQIPTGIMASEKEQVLFRELLQDYDGIHFRKDDGTLDLTTNVHRITNTCLKYGLTLDNEKQTVQGFTFFPMDFFCPKDATTRELNLTKNSVAIHHFDGSWMTSDRKLVKNITEMFGYRFTSLLIKIKHIFKRGK